MNDGGGPSPLLGLVAALALLIAGIASALTRDSSTKTTTEAPLVPSTQPSLVTASTTGPRATFGTLPTTSLPPINTTLRPAVPTPEAAANGLWAAYTVGNRSAASRFASTAVADALFEQEYSGEEGTFQGCRKQRQGEFECDYVQASTRYTMTAEADDNSSYKIVVIVIA